MKKLYITILLIAFLFAGNVFSSQNYFSNILKGKSQNYFTLNPFSNSSVSTLNVNFTSVLFGCDIEDDLDEEDQDLMVSGFLPSSFNSNRLISLRSKKTQVYFLQNKVKLFLLLSNLRL